MVKWSFYSYEQHDERGFFCKAGFCYYYYNKVLHYDYLSRHLVNVSNIVDHCVIETFMP